jgi:S1-C subfamily serine protease
MYRLSTLFVIFFLLHGSVSAEESNARKIKINPETSIASGFFVTDDGYLITAYHAIADFNEIIVLLSKKKAIEAKVVKFDEDLDLALLKINSITSFGYLSHSKSVPAGMDVVTIGYPQVAFLGLTPKITRGIVNSNTGLQDDKSSFQFSAEVQQGNSGGPLVAPGGTIVGVVQSKLDALKLSEKTNDLTQNVNFATKSAILIEFLSNLPNLPSTQPLDPDQPLKAIRIYKELEGVVVPIIARNK